MFSKQIYKERCKPFIQYSSSYMISGYTLNFNRIYFPFYHFLDKGRHHGGHISIKMSQLPDAGRRKIGITAVRHKECCFQGGINLFYHQGSLEFIFKIAECPESPDQEMAVLFCRIFIEKPIKSIHFHIGDILRGFLQHGNAFFRSKHVVFCGV